MKFDDLLFEGTEHALRRYVVGPTPEESATEAARRAEAMAKIVRYVLDRAAAECLAQAAVEESPAAQLACQTCANRIRHEADRQPEGAELVPIQLTDADRILLASRQHTA